MLANPIKKKKKNNSGWKKVKVWVTQSCLTPCDPMDWSPLGFSVYGILQARLLQWVAISFSGDLPDPGIKSGSPALQADSLLSVSGKPKKPWTRALSFQAFIEISLGIRFCLIDYVWKLCKLLSVPATKFWLEYPFLSSFFPKNEHIKQVLRMVTHGKSLKPWVSSWKTVIQS